MTIGELIKTLKEFPESTPVLAREYNVGEDDEEYTVRVNRISIVAKFLLSNKTHAAI